MGATTDTKLDTNASSEELFMLMDKTEDIIE